MLTYVLIAICFLIVILEPPERNLQILSGRQGGDGLRGMTLYILAPHNFISYYVQELIWKIKCYAIVFAKMIELMYRRK